MVSTSRNISKATVSVEGDESSEELEEESAMFCGVCLVLEGEEEGEETSCFRGDTAAG